MNPFERHNITHLSPSSLNLYAANPSLWVGRYLLGWNDEFGPAAARGTAVEAGLDYWLYERNGGMAEAVAMANFADRTQGVADEDHEAERALIVPMLKQAISALHTMPIPVARQVKIEHYANGIEVPIIGYIDYIFEGFGLDLKTTKACPSSIKGDHGRQVATYAEARQQPFKVLYVTAKKSALYDLTPEDQAIHIRDIERHARAVRHLLKRSDDGNDAARFFAPVLDDFRWSSGTAELANTLWST